MVGGDGCTDVFVGADARVRVRAPTGENNSTRDQSHAWGVNKRAVLRVVPTHNPSKNKRSSTTARFELALTSSGLPR